MERANLFEPKYEQKDIGNNQIEDKGCKFIYEANWTLLEELWICNKI